jgi:hypothetical protein
MIAFNAQGNGWEMNKNVSAKMKFTGTQVHVTDERLADLTLDLGSSKEHYKFVQPMMVVGNLFLPNSRYMEGNGPIVIENKTLGISCEMNFFERGWTSNFYTNRIEAIIKDGQGIEKYSLQGYYTTEIFSTNFETEEEKLVFKAPEYPENNDQFYHMNAFALQLNQISESLKQKLPPSDCRFRQDMRLWENFDDNSEAEKERLEANQDTRRKAALALHQDENPYSVDADEQELYTPMFFNKEVTVDPKGEKYFTYSPIEGKYWKLRESGDWSEIPKIFE